jgi:tetratricopeptide (TPR) repeat protein
MTIEQALDVAINRHQSGRLAEAEEIYRQILAQDPNHPDALHLLGVLAYQANNIEFSVQLIQRAIAINSSKDSYFNNLGLALMGLNRVDEAIAAYEKGLAIFPNSPESVTNYGNALYRKGQHDRAIELFKKVISWQPTFADAWMNMGNALMAKKQGKEAIAAYRQALEVRPGYAEALNNLGNALYHDKKYDEAIAIYHQALKSNPNMAETHYNLANALCDKKFPEQAIAAFRQALALKPNYADAANNLGSALQQKGDPAAAVDVLRRALQMRPDFPETYNNLGNALHDLGELSGAIAAFNKAIALKPDYVAVYSNLAKSLYQLGKYDEVIACCRKSLSLDPDFETGHFNLGICLLLLGDFEQGWKEYAWRWQVQNSTLPQRNIKEPIWDGSDLQGKTILLHAEQGFGDTLQFVRYLPMVRERGGKIILACEPPLGRLLRGQFEIEHLVVGNELVPPFETHCPLLNLPLAFGTTLQTIPDSVPYIKPPESETLKWRQRLSEHKGIKIGICWAGRPTHPNDRNRSIALSTLLPHLKGTGTFISLQKAAAGQIQQLPPQLRPMDWTNELMDFADTAGLVASLDLVISVDTAIVHLAGAMGKPVWVLLPYAPDWRWMIGREDSPWYPTMRLFRQQIFGDWSVPLNRLSGALSEFLKDKGQG